MSENWQPIEKYPREYEIVLVGRENGNQCTMAGCWTGERWLCFSMAGALEIANPTHWQPLPEPPRAHSLPSANEAGR